MMRKQATSHNLCTYKHITQVVASHGGYAYSVGDGEDLPWPADGETQRRWGINLLLANRFQTRNVVLS